MDEDWNNGLSYKLIILTEGLAQKFCHEIFSFHWKDTTWIDFWPFFGDNSATEQYFYLPVVTIEMVLECHGKSIKMNLILERNNLWSVKAHFGNKYSNL